MRPQSRGGGPFRYTLVMQEPLPEPLEPQPPNLLAGEAPHSSPGHRIFWGPQGLRSGWRLLLFVVLAFLISGGLNRLIRLWLQGERPSTFGPEMLGVGELAGLVAVLAAAWIMGRIERRPLGIYGLPARWAFGKRFWAGAIWGLVAVSMLMGWIWAGHGFSLGTLVLHGFRLGYYAVAWWLLFLVVGLFEEFTARGYPQFTLTTGIGFWPAAALTSAFFGAIHLTNPGEGWVGALSAALIGLFLAFTLRRTGDLWFAVGFHQFFDYGETFLYSVPNSGLRARGTLLSSSFHGPNWLTGGTIGPEGSVFVFVLIGLLFAAFHFAYPAKCIS